MTMVRTMLVDDCELMRRGLVLYLRNNCPSFEIVAEAANGFAATERIRELQPDLVVMDVRMPGMDGITTTREIKRLLPETKVLIYSANDSDEEVFAALSAGAIGYCLKGSPPDLIVLAVSAVARGAGWIDPRLTDTVFGYCAALRNEAVELLKKTSERPVLSARELEVVALMTEGLSNQEIASRLRLSPETVKSHLRSIMKKLEVSDRTQAAVKAIHAGLI